MEGWVSLYRKFINWQWYKDANVKAVFIHLLLCANHKEECVGKRTIKRGQLITSRESLSKATGLSQREIRTCLSKLKSTDEIEIEKTNKYSVITIKKYDMYQRNSDEEATSKTTSKATNKNEVQATSKNSDKTTNKKNLETIENKEENKTITEEATNKKSTIATNKNEVQATSKKTNKATTNNNIYNNINNNYITKLNYIFNLIINNKEKEIELTKNEFQGFKNLIRKLDLEVTDEFINYATDDTVLKYKVIYFSLYAIYMSPNKIYLNTLTRQVLFNKLFKTEEYIRKTN